MSDTPQKTSLDISTNTLVKIALLGILLFVLVKLIDVVLIILTSIVIASFISGASYKLKRYVKNRTFAVFLIYISTIGIFVGLAYVFVPVFIQEMSLLVSSLGHYVPNNSILNTFQTDTISGAKSVVSTISHNGSLAEIIKNTQNLVASLSGGFFDIFGQAFGGMFNLGLILILSFYFSIQEKGIEGFLRIVSPDSKEEYVIDLWRRTERKIGLWIQGQMLLGLIIGVLAYLGLTILGVKYSFILAIATAFSELIPFGLFLVVIPAMVFAYLNGSITIAFLTLFLYFILHQFENYLIYPLIVKKVIGISPLVVILAILIGGTLAGFWGVILAIPCAVCLLEFLNDLEKKKIARSL